MRISHVIYGLRPVPAELALLLGKAFNQSPEYWLNRQTACDLAHAHNAASPRLKMATRFSPCAVLHDCDARQG